MSATTKAGPRNADTDTRGIRTYIWKGQELTSVTSLRRLIGVPFPLANWMVEQVIGKAVAHSSNIDTMVAIEGDDAAKSWLRKEGTSERDEAANRGTTIHNAAALRTPVDPDSAIGPTLFQFYDFLAYSKAVELLSERQVFNLTLGYAGSLDAVYYFPPECPFPRLRGRRLVIDLKTGKGVYADHALQLMGYAMGEFIGEDDVVDEDATVTLLGVQGLAILHLSDTDWELIEVMPSPKLFGVFRAMCEFAHWQKDNPSIDGLVVGRYSK